MSEIRGQRSDKELQGGFAANSALPFKTQDAILANCLRVAGLTEMAWSPMHIYDADILFRIGGGQRSEVGGQKSEVRKPSRFAGLTSIEAARKAWKEGSRGRVEYHFEHSPIIEPLLAAYSDQVKQIEQPASPARTDGDAGEAIREIMRRATGRPVAQASSPVGPTGVPPVVMDEREALLRILCVALKLRITFVNRWKDVTPVLLVPTMGDSSSHTTPDGVRIQKYPGGKLVRIDASDEILHRMKLL